MEQKHIIIEGQETPYLIRDDGTVWSEIRNRELKGTLKRNEYHTVYLSFNGKQYNFMIHRLVAEYFCDNPNNYTIVHHKDGNPHNNQASNLEWVDSKINNATKNKKPSKEKPVSKIADLTKNWIKLSFNENYAINIDGEVANLKTGLIVKGSERNGYLRISIRNKQYSIHRLVWETFNQPIPEGYYIDHIDGNKSNNALSNLRLVTQSDNMKNAMKNGHKGQILVFQYDKEGNFIQEFESIQKAADAMGVSHAAIRSAIDRNGTCKNYIWQKALNTP